MLMDFYPLALETSARPLARLQLNGDPQKRSITRLTEAITLGWMGLR